jgi:hypothetical protein
VSTRGVEGLDGGDSQWRLLQLVERPALGNKLTSPSRWSSPMAL